MIIPIIGIIFGIVIAAAGFIFLAKEKDDPESRKIYTIVCVIGIVIIIAAALFLIF